MLDGNYFIPESDEKPLVGVITDGIQGLSRVNCVLKRHEPDTADSVDVHEIIISKTSQRFRENALRRFDGFILMGGNVIDPSRYGAQRFPGDKREFDLARDETCLPFLAKAIERGIPVTGICRGAMEIQVVRGGILDQTPPEHSKVIHDILGRTEWKEYCKLLHPVTIQSGGVFEPLYKGQKTFDVTSSHIEVITKLAHGLFAEAVSPDGTVEIFSASRNLVGVMFHPECVERHIENPDFNAIFSSFKAAAHEYWERRNFDAKAVRAINRSQGFHATGTDLVA
jgi:putative glutamine amidotransferase